MMLSFNLSELNIQPLSLFCIMVAKLNKIRPTSVKWNDTLSINDGVKFTFSIPPRNWKPENFQQLVVVSVQFKNAENKSLDVMELVHAPVETVAIPTYGMYGQNTFYDTIEDVIKEIIEDHDLARELFGEIGA